MTNVEAEIVQLLATYGAVAGTAAAQSLGSAAIKGIGSLWEKIRQKFKKQGGVAEATLQAFEEAPDDQAHQKILLTLLEKYSQEDPTFAQEISQLLSEVKQDPQ